jgi:hypothetical protein
VAATDPIEMNRVSHTVTTKITTVGIMITGVRTENTPAAVATPFPPRNRSQTG